MSLVVCSNQDENRRVGQTGTTSQNIFKPYSFRNGLSSTYTIPKNGQVALQSAKYTLDGRYPLTSNQNVLYQYYGEDLADDGDINYSSTACPIRTPLFVGAENEVREVTVEQIASETQARMRTNIFHPQLQNQVGVSVDRDGTSDEFQGFTILYDYFDSLTSVIPPTAEIVNAATDEVTDTFAWDGTTFESLENNTDVPAVGMLTGSPISLHNGTFIVNFNDPNSVGVDWAVGLSRFNNNVIEGYDYTGFKAPDYFVASDVLVGGAQEYDELFYYDYLVCRDSAGVLKVFHTAFDSNAFALEDKKGITTRELEYGNDDIAADYDLDANADAFHKVRFTCTGQQIKIEMLTETDVASTLYEYNSARSNAAQLSAISQAKWSMFPVLYLENDDSTFGNQLIVEEYVGSTTANKLGDMSVAKTETQRRELSWYNSVEGTVDEGLARELETRPWNDQSVGSRSTILTYAGLKGGTNDVIDLENYLIFTPSDTFKPSYDANSDKILGFVGASPTNAFTFASGTDPHTRRVISSVNTPSLLATRSMFIRLDNFTQQSVNALMGNKSGIISHLPRFDGQVETGRIYHEPKNLIYLDLNNSEEIKLSSFDISFVYSNEQYVESLTGTSVVVLYIRQKPS
jgi:hypothetical protein